MSTKICLKNSKVDLKSHGHQQTSQRFNSSRDSRTFRRATKTQTASLRSKARRSKMKKLLRNSNKGSFLRKKKSQEHLLNSLSIMRLKTACKRHTSSNFCQGQPISKPTTVCSLACPIKVSVVLGLAKSTKHQG